MVNSINALFDAWVDRGGSYRRLAMGHTLGSVIRLLGLLFVVAILSFNLGGAYAPTQCLVLFVLPFVLTLANRTLHLSVGGPSERNLGLKTLEAKLEVKCEPIFFASRFRDTFVYDAWVTSAWCHICLLLGCLPLMLYAIVIEGRFFIVVEMVIFAVLIGVIACCWQVGHQFCQKKRSISMLFILIVASYGLPLYFLEPVADQVSFLLSFYPVVFSMISAVIAALMVSIVLFHRAHIVQVPDVSSEFVPRCSLLVASVIASILGSELIHPVVIGALGLMAFDVLTAHSSNSLRFVPSLFTKGKFGLFFRLFFFPGWQSLSLFVILTLTILSFLQPYSFSTSIFASDFTGYFLLFVFVPVILLGQIGEIRRKSVYFVNFVPFLALIFLSYVNLGFSNVIVGPLLLCCAFSFFASILYGIYDYLTEGSTVGDVRIIVDDQRVKKSKAKGAPSRAGDFLTYYRETGPLFLWRCANSSVDSNIRRLFAFTSVMLIVILGLFLEISSKNADTLLAFCFCILFFMTAKVFMTFLCDGPSLELISRYREWYDRDKKLALAVTPVVAFFFLSPMLLLFPESVFFLGQKAVVGVLLFLFLFMACNFKQNEESVYRFFLNFTFLVWLFPKTQFSVAALVDQNGIFHSAPGSLGDRCSFICILLLLIVVYFYRKSGAIKDLLYFRSMALILVIVMSCFSQSISFRTFLIAAFPLIDTIVFELIRTPQMLPSLYRGTRFRTIASVVINPGWPGAFCYGQIALLAVYPFWHGIPGICKDCYVSFYYVVLGFGCLISPIAIAIAGRRCVNSGNYFLSLFVVFGLLNFIFSISRSSVYLETAAIGITLFSWPVVMYGLYRHIQLLQIKREYYCPDPASEFPWGH